MSNSRGLIQLKNIIFLLSLTIHSGILSADILSDGQAAIEAKAYNKAFDIFSAAANRGDAKGEYGMGVLHSEGWATEKDAVVAFQWFQKAAKQGHPPAQFTLGNAYFKGMGVEISLPDAEMWWDLSARNGYSQAQFNLGMLLFNEGGNAAAKEQGIAWTRAAAEQDIEWAAEQLIAIDEPINYSTIVFDRKREPARSEARIMTLHANFLTIILQSDLTLTAAIQIIKQQKLEGRALIHHLINKPNQFQIIYGRYESKKEAQETIASMKTKLKSKGPTISSINAVQSEIEAWRISQYSN